MAHRHCMGTSYCSKFKIDYFQCLVKRGAQMVLGRRILRPIFFTSVWTYSSREISSRNKCKLFGPHIWPSNSWLMRHSANSSCSILVVAIDWNFEILNASFISIILWLEDHSWLLPSCFSGWLKRLVTYDIATNQNTRIHTFRQFFGFCRRLWSFSFLKDVLRYTFS